MSAPAYSLRHLTFRPLGAADLSFEVDGILSQLNAKPGQTLGSAFDFASFYAGLGTVQNQGLLKFDSSGIDTALQGSVLASLRAEIQRSALDASVLSRQNSFLRKYTSSGDITSQAGTLNQKVGEFQSDLLRQIQNQANLLADAYAADQRTGVVKTTTSTLKSVTHGHDDSTNRNSELTGVAGGPVSGNAAVGLSAPETSWQRSSGSGSGYTSEHQRVFQHQTSTNTGYGYRVPAAEAAAGSQRSQIGLLNEMFSQFLKSVGLPHMDTLLSNELKGIDLGVRQLQIAYFSSYLLAPFKGVVSRVYRHVGERVRAGEPILRVEDLSGYYLEGTVASTIPISVGQTLSITAPLSGYFPSATLSGPILTVEGGPEENEYNVIVACQNTGPANQVNGAPLVPIGYRFNSYDTQVVLT